LFAREHSSFPESWPHNALVASLARKHLSFHGPKLRLLAVRPVNGGHDVLDSKNKKSQLINMGDIYLLLLGAYFTYFTYFFPPFFFSFYERAGRN
jgi:hypothetical protein